MSDKRKNRKNDQTVTAHSSRAATVMERLKRNNKVEPSAFAGSRIGDLSAQKKFDIFIFIILFVFGIYQSIIYWGHQPVPHFDFHCFVAIGREILSFQIPSDYKRVPLTGILQIFFGKIAGGDCPELHGGWLLNSISHTLTLIFLWAAARKLIGIHAIWFAVIAIINPFGLQLLTESIAETPMLFFIWITFYLIFIRSKWAYLLAALATMVRYECAALIAGMFVFDMIDAKNKKERLLSFAYASLASVPLALWMVGTFLSQNTGGTHYLNIFRKNYTSQFVEGVENRTGFLKHAEILWQTGFYPLLQPSPGAEKSFMNAVFIFTKIFVAVTFALGAILGLIKKQWKILVLLIFLVPYFIIHAKYPYPIHRYHATIFAIVMLICVYGLCSFWSLVKNKIPKAIVITLQVILFITALTWLLNIADYLPRLKPMSAASVSLPLVAILVSVLALAAWIYFDRKFVFTKIVIVSVLALMIISNQFVVAGVVGNGERDIEFKYLTDWYVKNAKPAEKLVTTVPAILAILSPKHKDNFIHTNTFDANTPEDFVRECYQKNITYVAWDSREGLIPHDHYYKYWKMSNIAPLAAGKDIGPYQFITQFRVNQRRYLNLYRLRPLDQVMKR